jgi:myo-inositol 2-dehydrogenase / D-chiro-inositol 1-dehydrogenase
VTTTRIGVVGAGYIAGRHVASLSAIEGVRVVGVADPREERAQALAATVGARPYPDHRGMLDGERLDAVYVCVPPFAHGPPELAALERGLPLFVEKPIARDAPVAEAVAAEIERRGVAAAAGYHWRYLDTFDRARELLAGNPCRLLLGWWLDRIPGTDWWLQEARSGGQLIEQTTHLFDLARALVGEIVTVSAEGARFPRRTDLRAGDILDVSTATVRFATGAVGSISSSCLLRRGHRIGVELIAEGLAVLLTETELVVDDGEGPRTTRASRDPYRTEDRAFVAAVRGRPAELRVPYAEAVRTHRVAVAATRAVRDGGSVRLDVAPSGRG